MTRRIRPALVHALPILAFCALGVLPLLVGGVSAVITVAGIVLFAGGWLFLFVVLTTWFETDPESARVSSLARVRRFEQGETTLRFHKVPALLFGDARLVELVSESERVTVSLAIFGRRDREEIVRELRRLFAERGC